MPSEPLELQSLSELRTSQDGSRIAFTINCKGGESAAISCALTEIMDIVTFLLRGAEIATEQSGSARPAPKIGQTAYADPVSAQGIGFAASASPDETLLLVRTTGLDLVFSVPSSGLAQLAPELAQIATTMSAGTSKH